MSKENEKIISDGFKYPETIDKKDYILGAARSAPFEVVNDTGDWLAWIPDHEEQRRRIDTNGCTNFGSLNLVEILSRYLFKMYGNYSERFQAVVSDQQRDGNNPHKVLESMRTLGIIEEFKLAFEDWMDFDDYLSPKPMQKMYLDDAKEWLEKFEFKHEYVYDPFDPDFPLSYKQKLLMEALKRSPVGISVYAWQKGSTGLYAKPQGAGDTHWTCLVGAKEGEYWVVYDSYDPFVKKLEWDFQFDVAKGIWLKKKEDQEGPKKQFDFWGWVISIIQKLLR